MTMEKPLYRTILLGDYISVQGPIDRVLEDGQVQIRIGETVYQGRPVTARPQPAALQV